MNRGSESPGNTGSPKADGVETFRLQSRELLYLSVALVVVLCVALISSYSWFALRGTSRQTEQAQFLLNTTRGLLSSLKDAEAGQRGYLLTATGRYLEPYRQASVDIPKSLTALNRTALANDSVQARRIEKLNRLVQAKLAELRETIELRRTKGLDAALAVVRTDRGQEVMDQVRELCTQLDQAAAARLDQSSGQARSGANQLALVSAIGSASLFLLLCLAMVAVRRNELAAMNSRKALETELKRAENALRESHELLEQITGVAPAILYIYDIQASQNIWINRGIGTTLGYSPDEMQAMGSDVISRLLHKTDATKYARHLENIRALADREFAEWEYRMLHKDGSWRWISSRDMVYARDAGGVVTQVVGAAYDRTGARQMEAALEESEHRFRTLTESLPLLVWTCRPDGSCDYLSPQWAAYTGTSDTDQLDLAWQRQIHPDDLPPLSAAWSHVVQTGHPFLFEHRIRNDQAQYRWFEARAIPLRNGESQIVKWFGTSTDIHEARQTRDELERERSLLSKLVSLAPAVFCSFALRADGTSYFSYAGIEMTDLLGVSPEDLNENAEVLFSALDSEEAFQARASLSASATAMSPWRSQFRVLHPDKGQRWIEVHSTPSLEGDGVIVWHGFLTDITGRKQVEKDQQFLLNLGAALQNASSPESVAQSATHMAAEFFDVARCSLSAIDVTRMEAKLLCEYTRYGASAVSGLQSLRNWARRDDFVMLAEGKSLAIDDALSDPVMAQHYSTKLEPLGIRSLIVIPLRRSGALVSLLGLFVPVARAWSRREIDLAQAAGERIWLAYEAARASASERNTLVTLAASEERLRVALEASSIGIWESEPLTGKRHWDLRSRELFGFPADLEISPEVTMSCVHPEDRDPVQRQLQSYYDPAGSGHFQAEYRILTWNDRTLRHIYGHGKMLFQGEGPDRQAVRAIGTLQDITPLKHGEQTLRRLNRELEQFAYAAAHDLQEPLRNVALATQLIASRHKGNFDASTDTLLSTASAGALRMEAMVKDLLAFSQALLPELGHASFADSNAVLSEALQNLETMVRENDAHITSGNLPAVRMSRIHLLQVLQNLISNSIKYAGPQGPRIHVSSSSHHGQCTICVTDNGLGIPAGMEERAFGVFKRLHNRNIPGTGIGLALCRRIVEHYGGKIWIESEEGKGTTVLFTPPLV